MKLNPKHCVIFVAIEIIVFGSLTINNSFNKPKFVTAQLLPVRLVLTKADRQIFLEFAASPEELEMGLQHRPPLPPNRGMYFQFPQKQQVKIWMKNVSFPLDVVLLNGGIVREILTLPPCLEQKCPTYQSAGIISSAVEVPAGTVTKLGIKVGDKLDINELQNERQNVIRN